jgi:hypothetical protein
MFLSHEDVDQYFLFFSFALLCVVLCDTLWFNELYFTTKGTKVTPLLPREKGQGDEVNQANMKGDIVFRML